MLLQLQVHYDTVINNLHNIARISGTISWITSPHGEKRFTGISVNPVNVIYYRNVQKNVTNLGVGVIKHLVTLLTTFKYKYKTDHQGKPQPFNEQLEHR